MNKWGNYGTGDGQFFNPYGIAVHSGSVYVAEVNNCRVQKFAMGDGVGDACDNCPADPNLDQADSDSDGMGDACDICPLDADNDADNDGICGDVDPCPDDASNDADGDTVCGGVDNCPTIANSDQTDSDGDGVGDACDPCPDDADNDADGDGICGDVDNCPGDANTDQADGDVDDIGDVCDNCAETPNADQTDSDEDGLGDACDDCPLDPDNDADGDGVCGNVDACPSEDATGFDADENGCIDNVEGLTTIINTLPDDVLSDETKTSLISKVEAAQRSIDRDKDNAAIGQLNAFINEVNAQTGNKISSEVAAMLIAYAQNIIAQVEQNDIF
ncbi:MAG: hypothetical protein C4532_03075 [Candidatus Abyssobacteria bacterium SURF_17]|uniref:FIMAH domain-containing protein n=1 Tax=Candidatus Abyssobacteria bacterium SURF_17 TaxID=2093361 RepID=A0A419F6V1_9BACT|nr:MAG: hypothetical protein C4532_03075 [Candidatus Abyssubacteria bacterium SURF_17]